MKPDWDAIEADFLATGMKYPKLAEKWGVPVSTLKKRAMRGEWGQRFEEISAAGMEPEPEPLLEPELEMELEPLTGPIVPKELALELRSKRARRMIETTDRMMDHIIDALAVLKPEDTFALGTLVRALKDLREMQGLNRSDLDIQEQRLRLEKLRQDVSVKNYADEPITVEFVNMDGAQR